MKFLIFGGNGFLGSYLYDFLKKKYSVNKVSRKKGIGIYLKSLDNKRISKVINRLKPDIIINTIAATNIDKCEIFKKKAFHSNVEITKNIVDSLKKDCNFKKKPFFIHISTDQVYSGKGDHKENKTKPVNYYAKTKLLSEKCINGIDGCVLRTNFLGNSKTHYNFNRWINEYAKSDKQIFGYKNILFSPLAMDTLANTIIKISKKKINGVFNLGSVGGISKGHYILQFLNKNFPKYKKFKITNYKNLTDKKLAKRSLDTRLNCSKLIKKYKLKLPNTKTEVNRIIDSYRK